MLCFFPLTPISLIYGDRCINTGYFGTSHFLEGWFLLLETIAET